MLDFLLDLFFYSWSIAGGAQSFLTACNFVKEVFIICFVYDKIDMLVVLAKFGYAYRL